METQPLRNMLVNNAVVFISNTTLDGFREGDGDLMDKLTQSLSETYHVPTIRIIGNSINIPQDKKYLLQDPVRLISLCGEKRELDCTVLQERFLEVINNDAYKNKEKIIYIGSRLRAIEGPGGSFTFSESGAIFTQQFIRTLKSMNIKIVVCALEFKFFRRSYEELGRCYHSLNEHFFLADKIHFLTHLDKEDFESTIDQLQKTPCLQIIDPQVTKWVENRQKELETKLIQLKSSPIGKHYEKVEEYKAKKAVLEEQLKKEQGSIDNRISEFNSGKNDSDKIDVNKLLTCNDRIYKYHLVLNPEEKKVGDQQKKRAEAALQEAQGELATLIQQIEAALNIPPSALLSSQREMLECQHYLESLHKTSSNHKKTGKELKYLSEKKLIEDELEKLKIGIEKSTKYIFGSGEKFNTHKDKGVFISGIYTVAPLTDAEILEQSPNKSKLTVLAERQNNILCFGLIRGQKGFDEAIELSFLFKNKNLHNKVIIAGKLFVDLKMVSNIFCRIFNLDRKAFFKELYKALPLVEIQNFTETKCKDFAMVEKAITENKNIEKFNTFCILFYTKLATERPGCVTNIEVHFNVEEKELRKLAMRCKYAIKFDNKGMANNASTIVSCLGFYLPTFTTAGLLASKEFLPPEEKDSAQVSKNYSVALIILGQKNAYTVNENGELVPVNPSMEEVFNFINNEKDEDYRSRIEVIETLHTDALFDCNKACGLLIDNIFLPLIVQPLSPIMESSEIEERGILPAAPASYDPIFSQPNPGQELEEETKQNEEPKIPFKDNK